MNIGDVFLRLAADDKGFEKEVVESATKAGNKGGAALGRGMGKSAGASFGAQFKNALKPANLLTGVGLGVGAGLFGAVTSAIQGTVGALVDMAEAAIADEESQNRLRASMEQNIPEFDGNTEAIERLIESYQQLGFDDETLRDSLTLLVGATHDVAEAQDIQRLAMDLARFKGIDLRTASESLIKVYAGQYRSLKSLGIEIDASASRTEAFAAVQAVAGGQAEAFANTTAGAMAATQIALDELGEDLGQELIPIMYDLAVIARDDVLPALKEIVGIVKDASDLLDGDFTPSLDDLEQQLKDVAGVPVLGDLFEADEALRDLQDLRSGISDAAAEWGMSTSDLEERVVADIERLGITGAEAFERIKTNWANTAASADAWEAISTSISNAAFGVDEAAADMADGIPIAMQNALEEGQEVAKKTPGALASSLRDSIEDYDAALEDLTVMAENSVSDLAERQKIEGILASEELTEALNSDSTRTRLQAMELVNDLIADYELLAPGALAAGELVNPALNDGMTGNLFLASEAGEAIVDAAGNPLLQTDWAYTGGSSVGVAWANGLRSAADWARLMAWELAASTSPSLHGASPPPEGPLKDIDEGGRNVGIAWAEGLGSAAKWATQQAHDLAGVAAGALTPRMSPVGVGAVAGSAAGSSMGTGNTYILQVDGKAKVVGSREDVIDGWEQLARFGDRSTL